MCVVKDLVGEVLVMHYVVVRYDFSISDWILPYKSSRKLELLVIVTHTNKIDFFTSLPKSQSIKNNSVYV